MTQLSFKIAFIILWIIYIIVRAPFDSQHKQAEKLRKVNSATETMSLILLAIGLMLIPLVWMFSPFLDAFSMGFPAWLRLFGVGIAILSLIYFRKIHKELGANWSPTLEIKVQHQLIKTGPYKSIRHPMYTQIWMWAIAQALIVSNIYAGFSGIIAWGIVYFIRVPKEEKMMQEYFGKEYTEYMARTGSVLPKIKL
jgi:protein-S-isoprenylcysteine O-methyltransferase Ste14